MTQDGAEAREFSRVPFHIVAGVTSGDTEHKANQVRDISLKGIFLEGVTTLETGTGCTVHLKLEGVEPPIEMALEGEVSRKDESGSGIHFTRIPLESFEHLQQIVQLNSTDPNKCEDEFKGHLGLNPR